MAKLKPILEERRGLGRISTYGKEPTMMNQDVDADQEKYVINVDEKKFNASKPMRFQFVNRPFDTVEEAVDALKDYASRTFNEVKTNEKLTAQYTFIVRESQAVGEVDTEKEALSYFMMILGYKKEIQNPSDRDYVYQWKIFIEKTKHYNHNVVSNRNTGKVNPGIQGQTIVTQYSLAKGPEQMTFKSVAAATDYIESEIDRRVPGTQLKLHDNPEEDEQSKGLVFVLKNRDDALNYAYRINNARFKPNIEQVLKALIQTYKDAQKKFRI